MLSYGKNKKQYFPIKLRHHLSDFNLKELLNNASISTHFNDIHIGFGCHCYYSMSSGTDRHHNKLQENWYKNK